MDKRLIKVLSFCVLQAVLFIDAQAQEDYWCPTDGMYIPQSWVCDGEVDCQDYYDERYCDIGCPPDMHTCLFGNWYGCINYNQFCDGEETCLEDEAICNHNCEAGYTICPVEQKCIPITSFCDGQIDCSEGFDEYMDLCQVTDGCLIADAYKCPNSDTCIQQMQKCDGQVDCDDESDEQCPEGCGMNFQCGDGTCVSFKKMCDGQNDCGDGSDEGGEKCQCENADQHRCKGGQCIGSSLVCNAEEDCFFRDDEHICADSFWCKDHYISGIRACDDIMDCENWFDEWHCDIGCPEDQYTCLFGRMSSCISYDWFCDGEADCLLEEDENEDFCNEHCPSGHLRCHIDQSCIPVSKMCDGVPDCSDLSDEGHWSCPTPDGCYYINNFKCQSSPMCISDEKQCDGIIDCDDGSDENCPDGKQKLPGRFVNNGQNASKCCPDGCHGNFQCDDGSCISFSMVCDGIQNCVDGSDESDVTCACPLENQFKCQGGACIDSSLVCDGTEDCFFANDEHVCDDSYWCPVEEKFVSASRVCDGIVDCDVSYDERYCDMDCGEQVPCLYPSLLGCIDYESYCNGVNDGCYDEDVEFCTKSCGPGQFYCQSDNMCIHFSKMCDNVMDCTDGGDEYNGMCKASVGCISGGHFQCPNNNTCIPNIYKCDGTNQCADGWDEQGCQGCGNNFQCNDGGCANFKERCDGKENCADGSDELNCVCENGNEYLCHGGVCIDMALKCNGEIDCYQYDDELCCDETCDTTTLMPATTTNVSTTNEPSTKLPTMASDNNEISTVKSNNADNQDSGDGNNADNQDSGDGNSDGGNDAGVTTETPCSFIDHLMRTCNSGHRFQASQIMFLLTMGLMFFFLR